MKLYWWPYLLDEYFHSTEFIAIAPSLRIAKELAKAKVQILNVSDEAKIQLVKLLDREPESYNLDSEFAESASTDR